MRVLITGSAKGIGRAIAMKFVEEGHMVYGLDILPSTIDEVNYMHFVIDIRDTIPPYLNLPGVDILINNAGVQNSCDDISVNLKGTINITEKFGIQPNIKSIIFMASASASTGAEFPEYAASKGGIVSYMKNVAHRIAPYGATSNSISAGGVTTELNKHIMEDSKMWRAVLDETLLNQWASPVEIAEWTYFIAVNNRSMTGQDILIDNGEALKSNFIW